jgi:hypothetical protein
VSAPGGFQVDSGWFPGQLRVNSGTAPGVFQVDPGWLPVSFRFGFE